MTFDNFDFSFSLKCTHTVQFSNHLNSSPYVTSIGGGVVTTQVTGLGLGISSQFLAAGLKADGSCNNCLMGDGPPTPTQDMDLGGTEHRKCKFVFCLNFILIWANGSVASLT